MADDDLEFMGEIIAEFIVESNELLEKLDTDLIDLEKSPDDLDLINEIFRAAHTFKGTSGFLGFDKMTNLTHAAEDILNRMRKGNLAVTPEIMDAILETVDVLKVILENINESNTEGDVEVDALIETLKELNEESEDTSAEPVSEHSETDETETEASRDSSEFTMEAETEDSEPDDDAEEQDADKTEKQKTETKTRQQKKPEPIDEPVKMQKPTSKKAQNNADSKDTKTAQTVRVPVARLDHLMNLAGELVLGRNRLSQVNTFFEASVHSLQGSSSQRFGNGGITDEKEIKEIWERNIEMLSETNSALALITSELQMAIMQTRMMQVASLFKKVPRLVRSLSRETNKRIELIIEGEETELDKSVIEELGDPLTHLIRNSMDHGIESPEIREANGKNPVGKLKLFASQEGNHITVGIQDDGAGIDPEKIKNRAIEKGVITESEARRMNDREAFNLIFQPGFSTAKKVTSVSGRGVGMDVVKTNVSRLNGMIEVESEKGKGSTFLLKLPLTLAIIQGLLVKVVEEVYIVPIVSVLETVRVTKKNLNVIGSRQVIRLRDTIIPVVNLEEFFRIERKKEQELSEAYVVVVGVANKLVGLIVDRLLGQEEVVIKSLGEFFENSEAIAGATIMGDGRVRLIVDISEIVRIEQESVA